jgi:hypothetical protein
MGDNISKVVRSHRYITVIYFSWFISLVIGLFIFVGLVSTKSPLWYLLGALHILVSSSVAIVATIIAWTPIIRAPVKKRFKLSALVLSNFGAALLLIMLSYLIVPRLVIEIKNQTQHDVVIESFEITGETSSGMTIKGGDTRHAILYPNVETESYALTIHQLDGSLETHLVDTYVTTGRAEEFGFLRIYENNNKLHLLR